MVKLGEDVAGGKIVVIDNAFWESIKGGPVVDYVKWHTGDRNHAYRALMYLVAAWGSDSKKVSEGQLLSVLTAVLDWGMLSDYLAVNGAVTRYINRGGVSHSSEWEVLFRRMSDVVPLFVNEWVAAGVPEEVIGELKPKFAKLFESDSYESFSVELSKFDAEMTEFAKTHPSDHYELYISSSTLAKIAKLVYRNRGILSMFDESQNRYNAQRTPLQPKV